MEVQAPIVQVTVYPDRVRVTRRGTVQLEAGPYELVVPELTLLLDPDSVRVGGEGTAQVRLLGVDVEQVYYTETPSTTAAELTRRLQEKRDQDRALEDERTLLRTQLTLLDSLATHAGESLARGIGWGRAKIEDSGALLSFLSTRHAQLTTRERAIDVQRRDLAAEIEVLERELAQVRNATPRERYRATVGVEALTGGNFTLALEYTTHGGAGWRPLYDLRLNQEKPAVELAYLAQVHQSTGEDWVGVALILSTARPAVSADLPELSPWYLELYVPAPPRALGMGLMTGSVQEMVLPAAVDRAPAPEALPPPAPVAATPMQAQIDTSGAAVTFHIPRPADIPADGTPHETTIVTMDMAVDLDYLTVPKLVNEVYRRVQVRNDSQVTLLPGPVSLFHGGEFVGRAALPKIAPQETFETTMGLDDRIKVERKMALKEVGKQYIGDRRVLRYAYEIELQNLLAQKARIVVRDQLPVAGHEEIKVRAEEITPPPASQGEQGELTWELELEPQQKQVCRFAFTVTAPRGKQLLGLSED